MSVQSDIPQVKALLLEVESAAGFKMQTHSNFINLVVKIEEKLHLHISETTLERIWNYSTRHQENISIFTLNALSSFAGYTDWEEFCTVLKKRQNKESELFSGKKINAANLTVGTKLLIGWMPDRLCTIEYQGNNTFKVINSENTSVLLGDTFKALEFQLGRPLYLQDFQGNSGTYAVGQDHGLTTLKIIH